MLLLLKCHEVKYSIWEAIDDQILPAEIDDQAKECFFKFVRENQSKVMLVLDGLDEMDSTEIESMTWLRVKNFQVVTLYSHPVMTWGGN